MVTPMKWRSQTIFVITSLLVIGVLSTPAVALELTTWQYRGFDGCDWDLESHDWLGSPPATKVEDVNGGCHYLTAYYKSKDGTDYHKVGPVNQSHVWSDASLNPPNGDFYVRGRVTTWEHEWTQDSDWKLETGGF